VPGWITSRGPIGPRPIERRFHGKPLDQIKQISYRNLFDVMAARKDWLVDRSLPPQVKAGLRPVVQARADRIVSDFEGARFLILIWRLQCPHERRAEPG
jgi:hypothetical protein